MKKEKEKPNKKNTKVVKEKQKKKLIKVTNDGVIDVRLFVIIVAIIAVVACWLVMRAMKYNRVSELDNGTDKVVSLKNESYITANELYEAIKEKYGNTVLVDLIDKLIFEEEFKLTDTEIKEEKQELDSIISQYEESGYDQNTVLQYYFGVTSYDEALEVLKLDKLRNKAIDKYLKDHVTDKEINKYYKDEIIGDINLKHILISYDQSEDLSDDEIKKNKENALKEAKSIITKLNNGEKWSDLVKSSDDENTKENDGSLGWVNYSSNFQESFMKAAVNLKVGKYTTTAVETTYGYHIIYKVEEKEKPALKDVKDDVIENIVSAKKEEDTSITYDTLVILRKEAGLVIEDGNLLKQYENYLDQIKALDKQKEE